MQYGLSDIALDEELLGHVQSKVVQSILKKWNVQSTIPTAIRHGPAEYGGLEIFDLRTEAGLEAIKFFRDSVYTGSENGKLLLMNLHYSQIEAGIGEPLLEYPSITLSYLTPTWLMSLRQFLHKHNITIRVTDEYKIPLQGSKDQYIMQSQHLQRYSASQQRDLKLVCLYLQVHTLADMSDRTKKNAISLNYLDAIGPKDFVFNSSWLRQDVPTKVQRRLWKRYIRSLYLPYVPYWMNDPLPVTPLSKQKADEPHQPSQSLTDFLDNLPKQHQCLLDGLQQLTTDSKVWKAFRSRRSLHLATDGGLSAQKGTHGWIISTGTTSLFQCSDPVDGPLDTSSSTRSELAGYASALLLIRALSAFWQTRHKSNFHWYCDSKSAISRVRRYALRRSIITRMPRMLTSSQSFGLVT